MTAPPEAGAMTYKTDGYGQRIVHETVENRRVVAVWRGGKTLYHPTLGATPRERAILAEASTSGADAVWKLNNQGEDQ